MLENNYHKKIYKSILVFLMCIVLLSINTISVCAAKYDKYYNARFGYFFKYPKKFEVEFFPDNGDGVAMKYKNTNLTMSGCYDIFNNNTGEKLLKEYQSYGEKMENLIVYKSAIYYEKKVGKKIEIIYRAVSKKYGVQAEFVIKCKKSKLKHYRKVAKKMRKSLKFYEVIWQ